MVRTTSVTIGEQLDDLVSSLISSGRYGSSEVMRSALRLLEQKEYHTETLRRALESGERSGESESTLHEIAARKKREHNV
jgi:antitoxin ParD1/3/4